MCKVEFGRSSAGGLQVDAERLRRAIDGKPLHADGAAGHALRRRVERPAQRRDQIGAGAPVAPDRQLHLRQRPACTSMVWLANSRSPITLSVRRPALRAVTATVMVSPGLYSGLSSATSSMSGVSAFAST